MKKSLFLVGFCLLATTIKKIHADAPANTQATPMSFEDAEREILKRRAAAREAKRGQIRAAVFTPEDAYQMYYGNKTLAQLEQMLTQAKNHFQKNSIADAIERHKREVGQMLHPLDYQIPKQKITEIIDDVNRLNAISKREITKALLAELDDKEGNKFGVVAQLPTADQLKKVEQAALAHIENWYTEEKTVSHLKDTIKNLLNNIAQISPDDEHVSGESIQKINSMLALNDPMQTEILPRILRERDYARNPFPYGRPYGTIKK